MIFLLLGQGMCSMYDNFGTGILVGLLCGVVLTGIVVGIDYFYFNHVNTSAQLAAKYKVDEVIVKNSIFIGCLLQAIIVASFGVFLGVFACVAFVFVLFVTIAMEVYNVISAKKEIEELKKVDDPNIPGPAALYEMSNIFPFFPMMGKGEATAKTPSGPRTLKVFTANASQRDLTFDFFFKEEYKLKRNRYYSVAISTSVVTNNDFIVRRELMRQYNEFMGETRTPWPVQFEAHFPFETDTCLPYWIDITTMDHKINMKLTFVDYLLILIGFRVFPYLKTYSAYPQKEILSVNASLIYQNPGVGKYPYDHDPDGFFVEEKGFVIIDDEGADDDEEREEEV